MATTVESRVGADTVRASSEWTKKVHVVEKTTNPNHRNKEAQSEGAKKKDQTNKIENKSFSTNGPKENHPGRIIS